MTEPTRHYSVDSCGKTIRRGPRLRRHSVATMLLALASVAYSDVYAQNISVTGGDVQTNVAPTTYDSITVSGTSALGAPSTYTAAAPLTLTNSLSVSSSGVFNSNANVTVANGVSVTDGGVLHLSADTLSASSLTFSGVGSVNHTGGAYSANTLSLNNGATLTYEASDSVTGSISLSGSSAFTLEKSVSVQQLSISSGGSLSRTAETISANRFEFADAAIDLIAGDSFFAPDYNSSQILFGGVVNARTGASMGSLAVFGTNSSNVSTLNIDGNVAANDVRAFSSGLVNLASGTLTASSLSLSGSGAATQNGGHYALTNLSLSNGATLTHGVGDSISGLLSLDGAASQLNKSTGLNISALSLTNGSTINFGPSDAISGSVTVSGGSTITLEKDLALSGQLLLSGSTALNRVGFHYAASNLSLNNGATLTYEASDSVTGSISLSGSSAFTLEKSVSVQQLSISSGGSLSRTAETISANRFEFADAAIDLIAGDSFFAPDYNSSQILFGGVVNARTGASMGSLAVFGTNSSNVSTLNIDGNVAANDVRAFSSGLVNLASGTLTASSLSLSGSGAATQNGGHYALTNLSLSNGATLTYGAGDSISNALSIDGISSLFAEHDPLSLNSLSITNGGVLYLDAFTGSGGFSNWGLRLLGNSQSFLESLITDHRITGNSGPMSVFYDPTSNYTFVTATSAVPEIDPAGLGSVMALVTGALALLERRKRSA